MRISDKLLRPIADRVEQTTSKRVDDSLVIEILAAVADKSGRSAAQALTQLQAPGLSRADQFAIAQAGLSNGERTDLTTLLDQSGFTFAPGAKNFLEALLGRATLDTGSGGGGPLPPPAAGVTADERGIRGTLEAGMVIEAINLSSAPDQRLHLTDTMELGRADASGKLVEGVKQGANVL